jgi:hypothetical protein
MFLLRKTTERMLATQIISTRKLNTDSSSRQMVLKSWLSGKRAIIEAIMPIIQSIPTAFFTVAPFLVALRVTNTEFKTNSCIRIWTNSFCPSNGKMIQKITRKIVSWRNLQSSNREILKAFIYSHTFKKLSQVAVDEN